MELFLQRTTVGSIFYSNKSFRDKWLLILLPHKSSEMSSKTVGSTSTSVISEKSNRKGSSLSSSEERETDNKCCRWVKKNLLLILTIVSVVLAIAIGLPLREANLTKSNISYISFPGEIMMNLLKMVVIPLAVTSLIANISQLDGKQLGKIGALALGYYLVTTVLAVILGIGLVLLIHPGRPDEYKNMTQVAATNMILSNDGTASTLMDLVRNMCPENLIEASVWQVQTKGGKKTHVRGPNVLGIIMVSIAIGAVLSSLGPEKQPVVTILRILDTTMMRLVTIIIWFTPIGIFSLVIGKIIDVLDFWGTLAQLGLYMVTVIIGLFIHSLFTLPLIYFLCTRKNPLKFVRGMLQALLTAFATASSSATLPLSMACLEDNLGLDPRIVRFVLPIGATVNMDGTALYEAVASIFIAQLHAGYDLTFGRVVVVSLTATLASIGAAAIPSVLASIGLPQEEVAVIIAVDWLLDRFRTTVNVFGDAIGCGIIDSMLGKKLPPLDEEETEI